VAVTATVARASLVSIGRTLAVLALRILVKQGHHQLKYL